MKRPFLFALGSLLIIAFQQCSNVTLQKDMTLTMQSNKLNGRFCYSQDRSIYSKYKLADFYILNLNLKSSNGELLADSNFNGSADTEDTGVNKTVTLSSLDSDMDGLPDFIEKLKGLNPNRDDLDEDGFDLDGITNKKELQQGSDPWSKQSTFEMIYNVQESTDLMDCGTGQIAYSFDVSQMPTVETKEFIDSTNLQSSLSLSHQANENVYLILARMLPENSKNDSLFLYKIFKSSISTPVSYSFSPKDFAILNRLEDAGCSNCGSTVIANKYTQVSAGRLHACALTDRGKVFCWGNNSYGQLGDKSFSPRLIPTLVQLNSEAKALSSGEYHTCALTLAEEVYCWGNNSYGQLGNGNTTDSNFPVKVQSLSSPAKRISSGSNHNCVELGNSTIKCWGNNNDYQLGTGTSIATKFPLLVTYKTDTPIFPLLSLSAGADHNCLTDKNGKAFCWGKISSCYEKQVEKVPTMPSGGNCITTTSFPQEIVSNSTINYFFARTAWSSLVTNGSINYGINLTASSPIYCWGNSLTSVNNINYGCAETEPTNSSYYSVGISNVIKLSLSQNKTCGIKKSGTEKVLECWGKKLDTNQIQSIPQTINEIKNPIDIAVADSFICAIDIDKNLWCWGNNSYGQLGINSIANVYTPTKLQ